MSFTDSGFDANDPSAYGDVWAEFLDEWLALTGGVPPPGFVACIEHLAAEAGGRRLLELAVGTGFLALPLVGHSLEIHGLDGSRRMLELLAEKAGGSAIQPWLADLADLAEFDLFGGPGGAERQRFDLIFFGSSSLFCLPDQDAQVRCFESTARHLAAGGRFVLSTVVYDDRWFTDGRLDYTQREGDGWRMRWRAQHRPAEQVVEVMRTFERNDEPDRHFPHRERYCSPAEMDLMARLAGLRLRNRWKDWSHHPFTGEGNALSVYELARSADDM